jgi:hypothetical protein
MADGCLADGCLQIRHLHRRQRRLQSFVAHLQPGAIDRLLQRLASQHTKGMRNASLLCRLPDAARDFVHDDVVVCRIAAQQTADADDRVVLFRFRQGASGDGNFECARNTNEGDVFFLSAGAEQPIVCALKKPLCNKGIEARDYKSKALTGRAQSAFNGRNRRFGKSFNLYFFFRGFSP